MINTSLQQILENALTGDESLLEGFGCERLTTAGDVASPGIHEWEERLTVQGSGMVLLDTHRSMADVSGEQIGQFQFSQTTEELKRMVGVISEAHLDQLPPFRIEPADLKVRLSIVIGGIVQEWFVGVTEPEKLARLRPMLQELDRLAMRVRQHPLMTLGLSLEVPESASTGLAQLPVTIRIRNSGSKGYWLVQPTPSSDQEAVDFCRLLYGFRQHVEPDVTPLPMEITHVALEPVNADFLPLLWVGPQSELVLRFTASMDIGVNGECITRAVYSQYTGENLVGGQPCLRGCVFSNESMISVK